MIIPIGHDRMTVKRLPWVTIILMALCVLVYMFADPSGADRRINEYFYEASDYYFQHTYLEIEPEVKDAFYQQMTYEQQIAIEVALEVQQFYGTGRFNPDRKIPEEQLAREQDELNRLIQRIYDADKKHPYRTWGLIPAEFSVMDLITYMFMHAGIMHLLGNLFFFYLSGPYIEDAWGRGIYTIFYLSAGVFAALLFYVRYPDFPGPLVGASGAIAGAMGAFAVRFWSAKIKFFYWIGFIFYGTFEAAAWLVLALWVFREFLFARAGDIAGTAGGVAYWAHVGGFVFGVLFAVAMRHFKIEERFIRPKIEAKYTYVDNVGIEQAMQAREAGRIEEALEILQKEARANPRNSDAGLAYWNMAVETDRVKEAIPALLNVIREELNAHNTEQAIDYWDELQTHAPSYNVNTTLKVKLVESMAKQGLAEKAETLIQDILSDPPTSFNLLIRLARAAHKVNLEQAKEIAKMALKKPEAMDMQDELNEIINDEQEISIKAAPPAEPEKIITESPSEPSPPPPTPIEDTQPQPIPISLQIIRAVPQKLDETRLIVNIENMGVKGIPLSKIAGISVAIIRKTDKSILIIDLFLSLTTDQMPLKVIRLLKFNPKQLIPEAEDIKMAVRIFTHRILNTGQAKPIPTIEAVDGNPFQVFASVAEYEKKLKEEL